MPHGSLAEARPREAEEVQPQVLVLFSVSAYAHSQLSPHALSYCLKRHHTVPPEDSRRMPRHGAYRSPAALRDATTRQRGGSRSWGLATALSQWWRVL